ncbi:MAG: Ig domain-containing protein [Mycoplasma sp.]|nr:Ig domain-containing protein [Mycoplasma sp.]
MKTTKILKSILFPTLGISAINIIAAVSTSCSYDLSRVTSVSLNKTSTTLAIDDNETLTATVLPENATDKTVTWNSNNESVATVVNGKITAVGLGNATITVTTNDGSKTATCEVNVIGLSGYIGITANEDSALTLLNNGGNNPDLKCSIDGVNWTTYGSAININQGQTLYLKGSNPNGWSTSSSSYSCLSIKGNISVSGNVMALLDNGAQTGESGDITDIPCNYCFYDLFRDSTGITSVSEDFLPATILKSNCYDGIFFGCTSLVTAPELPATTLTTHCYRNMFSGCSSLTTAPELPATALADYCYRFMFYECSSLNSIKISYIDDYNDTYFRSWASGVASSGTFYYNGSQTAQDFWLNGWTTKKF